MSRPTLRLDKLLWFLRLAKTRALAQQRAAEGYIRINGRRCDRAAQPVAVGDVLTMPLGARTTVIEVLALPTRRGPAPEAQACYRALDGGLDAGARVAIAGGTAEPLADPLRDPSP